MANCTFDRLCRRSYWEMTNCSDLLTTTLFHVQSFISIRSFMTWRRALIYAYAQTLHLVDVHTPTYRSPGMPGTLFASDFESQTCDFVPILRIRLIAHIHLQWTRGHAPRLVSSSVTRLIHLVSR